jgi:hypothetical protein
VAVTDQKRLDRKAKAAIMAMILIVLGIILLALRSCVVALTPEQTIAAPHSGDDQIVLLGKETMLLESGSVGSKIVSWLSAGGTKTRAFEVGDRSFPPGSDEPTQVGVRHLDRFAAVMKANSDVTARVIVPAGNASQSEMQLSEKRAARIRTELLARGVPSSRISTEARAMAANATTANGQPAPIIVVLSK